MEEREALIKYLLHNTCGITPLNPRLFAAHPLPWALFWMMVCVFQLFFHLKTTSHDTNYHTFTPNAKTKKPSPIRIHPCTCLSWPVSTCIMDSFTVNFNPLPPYHRQYNPTALWSYVRGGHPFAIQETKRPFPLFGGAKWSWCPVRPPEGRGLSFKE